MLAERSVPGGWARAMAARNTRPRGTGCDRQGATTPVRAMPREGGSTAAPWIPQQRAVSREEAMTTRGETAGVRCLAGCASPSRRHWLWRQVDTPVRRTPAREWHGLQRQGDTALQDATTREVGVAALSRLPPPQRQTAGGYHGIRKSMP